MDRISKKQTNSIDSKFLTKIEILEEISNILIIKNLDTQENIEKLNEHLKEIEIKFNELKKDYQILKNQLEENCKSFELLKTDIQNKLKKIYFLLKIFGFSLICSIFVSIIILFLI